MKGILALVVVPAAVLDVAGCSSAANVSPSTDSHMGISSSASDQPSMPSMPSIAAGDDATEATQEPREEDPGAATGSMMSAADVTFAQMMIPHHQQAVEMSTLAETRATDPAIVALAAQIKSAQQPEIDQMQAWLTAAGLPAANAQDMGDGMPGLLSDQQMLDLKAATGATFDRLFATDMMAHHAGAIEMAKKVVKSENPEVAAMAKNIIASQTAEIDQLKAFLAQ